MLAGLFLPATLFGAGPKLPRDAPLCARPGTVPIFLAPTGEPFRSAPGQPYPSARWFAGADANQDGALSRSEAVADADRFFATLDKDRDGRLTPEEVTAYERDIAPETALFAVRPDDFYERANGRRHQSDAVGRSADYGGAMGAGRYAWLNIPEPVAAADLDIDRVVTREEFAAAARSAFASLAKGEHIRLADLPRTLAQRAIEGPCRLPKVDRR